MGPTPVTFLPLSNPIAPIGSLSVCVFDSTTYHVAPRLPPTLQSYVPHLAAIHSKDGYQPQKNSISLENYH